MNRIVLTNGPWNGKHLLDSGKSVIRMGIAGKWTRGAYGYRPAPGARTGCAVYEPDQDRTRAFWSHNEWGGVVHSTHEAG